MIRISKDQNGYLLVTLDITEANLNNSEQFKEELIQLINDHNKKIVIDMGMIDYMDSSFLGALVSGLKHAMSVKSDVVLVCLGRDIYDLFTLIRLDKVFKIYDNFDEVLIAG
ncbi:MAG: anti-sigma factor antagonist [Sphingobacteriaceae bacterium]|nr:MAG: anti-sigma factor antagonist [Sphingobacteriaceae bacterium]